MRLLSLDLELEQPCNRIIQVGYVIGELSTGDILCRRSIHVRIDSPVSEYITQLTGITNDQNKGGVSLEEAYSQIEADVRELKPFMNPLTWGGGDSDLLRSQLGGEYALNYVFGRRWIDVKTIFIAQQMARGEPFLGGLRKSMNRVGCRFEGKAHDALVDAENTFKMFRHLLARGI